MAQVVDAIELDESDERGAEIDGGPLLWPEYPTGAARVASPPREAARRALRSMALAAWIVLTALVKYATNHIVAHIPVYGVRHAWYRLALGWEIGPGASVLMEQHVVTGALRRSRNLVSIGADSVINRACTWTPFRPIRISSHVSISSGVSLITGGHDINHPEFAGYAHPIIIEDYVWVCTNATILGGVTIGRGAVVCAGSVVTKDVAPFSIVAGVPAHVIGTRKLTNPAYSLNFRPLFE